MLNYQPKEVSFGSGQGLTGVLSPLDEVTFRGIAHSLVNPITSNATIDHLGAITVILGNDGFRNISSTGEILNSHFELTYDVSVPTVVTGLVPGGGFTLAHPATGSIGGDGLPVDGLIDFYIDGTSDAIAVINPGGTSVSGLTDGTLEDGSIRFGTVPEPASRLTFAGLRLLEVGSRCRRGRRYLS